MNGDEKRAARAFRDDTLTREQVQKILRSVDIRADSGLRDYALLSLIVSCGLSYSEVSRAKVGHLTGSGEEANLEISGPNSGRVAVPPHVMKALRAYWQTRNALGPDSPLFTGLGTHKNQAISVRSIGLAMKRAAQRSGVDKAAFTPASLRHTAVKLAAQDGKRLEEVKAFARHRCIETTHRYGGTAGRRAQTCGDTVASVLL